MWREIFSSRGVQSILSIVGSVGPEIISSACERAVDGGGGWELRRIWSGCFYLRSRIWRVISGTRGDEGTIRGELQFFECWGKTRAEILVRIKLNAFFVFDRRFRRSGHCFIRFGGKGSAKKYSTLGELDEKCTR